LFPSTEATASKISKITDKVWELVEAWQNRPLEAIYPIIFIDAIHIKLRRDGKVANTAVHVVLSVDLEGHRDMLGHWVADREEGANFWLSVITDLQNRGVQDIFIASMDGLTGFSDALYPVFPQTEVQRCIIHQICNACAMSPGRTVRHSSEISRPFIRPPTAKPLKPRWFICGRN
jgi:transposase-like protein